MPSGNTREQKEEDEQTERNGGKWIIKNTFYEWKQGNEGGMEEETEKRVQKGKEEDSTKPPKECECEGCRQEKWRLQRWINARQEEIEDRLRELEKRK